MILASFQLAAVSPTRQQAFRTLVVGHLLLTGVGVFLATLPHGPLFLGNLLLVMGIVEGSLLVGWRLSQLPKSQALEFLLVTPQSPLRIYLAEALVGLARQALATFSGLPLLVLLVGEGILEPEDLVTLLGIPLVWGAVTGLMLTTWAYENAVVRRWGDRVLMAGILLYLVVGVLAAENLQAWLRLLPPQLAGLLFDGFRSFHHDNPFGVMKFAMDHSTSQSWSRVAGVLTLGGILGSVFLLRSGFRLKGHFHDRHYRPIEDVSTSRRPEVGDQPLAWWAVKRVSQYSGRINLWLAGGFGLLYSVYTVFKKDWPPWLGSGAFAIFDGLGGIPVLGAALVLLAAVPAAYQYGLWDSNRQDRRRRLELLLLTRLEGESYWQAAAAAAWSRGKGYLAIAMLLWLAGWWAGQLTLAQVFLSLAAGVILWSLYFALGFRAFARGRQANLLGLLLTLGLPSLTIGLYQLQWLQLATLLPPGGVYQAATPGNSPWAFVGLILGALLALVLARIGQAECDRELRHWYDANTQGTG